MSDPTIERYVQEGFELGYNQPDTEPGIPLDEPWMSYYRQGMDAGRQARQEADNQYGGPAIGPDPGGESWDHYQERLRAILEEIFHQHEPHTEVETPEIQPGPGTL